MRRLFAQAALGLGPQVACGGRHGQACRNHAEAVAAAPTCWSATARQPQTFVNDPVVSEIAIPPLMTEIEVRQP
jgi:hypothetical protein